MNENVEVIQVRVREHTLEQIDRLQAMTRAPSRSDAVRRSIDITDMVVNEILKGGSVILQDKKGKQREILVTGLNS